MNTNVYKNIYVKENKLQTHSYILIFILIDVKRRSIEF